MEEELKQQIWAEGFTKGSEYGYNYHKNTQFMEEPWLTYCKGNTLQKAQTQNPYNTLNEIEE